MKKAVGPEIFVVEPGFRCHIKPNETEDEKIIWSLSLTINGYDYNGDYESFASACIEANQILVDNKIDRQIELQRRTI